MPTALKCGQWGSINFLWNAAHARWVPSRENQVTSYSQPIGHLHATYHRESIPRREHVRFKLSYDRLNSIKCVRNKIGDICN